MPSAGTFGGKPTIKINGAPISEALKGLIYEAVVDDHMHLPDQFTLVLRQKSSLDQLRAKIGDKITVESHSAGIESGITQAKIFDGEITGLEADFQAEEDIKVVVRAYDISHRLHRGRRTMAYVEETDASIVQKIAARNGVPTGKIEGRTRHEHVSQVNLTDWEFLKARAREMGYVAGVDDGKLYFCKPAPDGSPPRASLDTAGPVSLVMGGDLLEFHPRVSAVAQVPEVEARGWDYHRKRELKHKEKVSRSSDPATPELADGTLTPERLATVFGAPPFVLTERVLQTDEQVRLAAEGMAGQIASSMAEADGMARGNPKIKAGGTLQLSGMVEQFDGKWTVTGSRHIWDDGKESYRTLFTVSGRQERSMLGLASLGATSGVPSAGGPPILGVVPAIVTNINDRVRKMCRVKLKFPWLDDAYESDWVRVLQPASGQGQYGAFLLPEVNDEVLVAFEQGDIRRPYVIGALYNGRDQWPLTQDEIVKGNKVVRRGLKSRTSHRIEMFEADDPQGPKIEIVTGRTGKVQIIMDENQNKLIITCNGDIEIESQTGSITMKAKRNVNIEAQTGNAGLKAMTGASLEASAGNTTVKGVMVNIN